ncbi:extracellular solute-binding protein [Paenibacillus sp. HB172176]|uniref:extracellular solute-binding protein n=1 Tax=Paenibacillus sp. HB172176 TaxID=2493690 RepID=UPI00143A4715|nr:extracellular solute-binding protein [Paenibacillus sp. HB172176]
MNWKSRLYPLVLLVALGAVTVGCSSGNAGTEPSESATASSSSAIPASPANGSSEVNFDKHYTITMFQWGPKDIDPNDEIIKYIDEKFNIDFKVERILAKEYATNLELKIAADDMPDIFRYPLASAHIYNHLYEDGYLMNFAEYAEKYNLEGLKSYIAREGTEEFREPDGVFQLPSDKGKQGTMMVVRQDWLDQLGLQQPTTMDELKTMLQAFKDNNLGGKNTVPLTANFGMADIGSIQPSFTGAKVWAKPNGEWINVEVMPEFKDYLKYLADLYQSGLLDKEIFTANETQEKAKFVSGASGLYMVGANRYNQTVQDLEKNNPNAKVSVLIPNPAGPKGPLTGVTADYVDPVVAVAEGRDEDFLARVAALLDWMHSDDGIHILNFGIEGIHYNLVDGKMVTTDAYQRDILPALGHLTAMTTDYSAAAGNVEGVLKEHFDYTMEYGIAPPITNITYGDAAELIPAIDQKFDDWQIAFVTGRKDIDADWDTYVKEMNDVGLAKLTETVRENTKDWE